jgi:hypothetical protein
MGEGNRIWRILFIVALAVSMAVVGGVIGLLLGAALGGIHLDLYHRSEREAAGTEVILIPLYAIPIGILGAAAGLIGGLLLGWRRQKRSEVELGPSRDDPGAAADRARRDGLPE